MRGTTGTTAIQMAELAGVGELRRIRELRWQIWRAWGTTVTSNSIANLAGAGGDYGGLKQLDGMFGGMAYFASVGELWGTAAILVSNLAGVWGLRQSRWHISRVWGTAGTPAI